MKVGNLQVICSYWPVLGPNWSTMWIPKCGCALVSVCILFFFTTALSGASPVLILIMRVVIVLEFVCFWLLSYSNPGIPAKILEHAKLIS